MKYVLFFVVLILACRFSSCYEYYDLLITGNEKSGKTCFIESLYENKYNFLVRKIENIESRIGEFILNKHKINLITYEVGNKFNQQAKNDESLERIRSANEVYIVYDISTDLIANKILEDIRKVQKENFPLFSNEKIKERISLVLTKRLRLTKETKTVLEEVKKYYDLNMIHLTGDCGESLKNEMKKQIMNRISKIYNEKEATSSKIIINEEKTKEGGAEDFTFYYTVIFNMLIFSFGIYYVSNKKNKFEKLTLTPSPLNKLEKKNEEITEDKPIIEKNEVIEDQVTANCEKEDLLEKAN
jgi:hypothetical protein